MRPIDADELKEYLRQYFTDSLLDGVNAKLAFNQILHDIDNAPTIEFRLFKEWKCTDCKERENSYDAGYKKAQELYKFTLDDVENFYRRGLEKGLSEWETERPQGKWINHEEGYNVCPFCEYKTAFSYNFCPNCGADMRGEKNG